MATLAFVAANFAQNSENRIHADDVAQRYGFRGGLVPGVTSFAYVIDAVVAEFGRPWCDSGRLNMRLLQPLYEHDVVTASCDAGGTVRLIDAEGSDCVEGRASTVPVVYVGELIPEAEVPSSRPPADGDSLAPGTVLGTLRHVAAADHMRAYLESVNIDPEPWEKGELWHPGVLLLDANDVLSRNVLMGPWIHVGSDLSLFASVPLDTPVETRAVVRDRYDRKGHEIVELDVTVHAQSTLVAHIHHTAIYKPRVRREP